MKRPHQSRWQLRQAAARAFQLRNRTGIPAMRQPDPGETPLSPAEMLHGVRNGLIAVHPAHARTTEDRP